MMRVLIVFWLFGIVVGLGLTGIWSARLGRKPVFRSASPQ